MRHPEFNDDFDQFYDVITAVDIRYLELADARIKREMEKASKK